MPSRMIRSRIYAPVLLALALLGCGEEPPTQSPPGPPAITVALPLVTPIVEWDRYIGRLDAVESVEVRARVSGYLNSLHFEEGQIIEKGQLLAVIDQRPFETVLARRRAEVAEAEARLVAMRARVVQASSQRDRAQSQRDLAARRLENAKTAAETNAIAREQVETRESELSQADAELGAAEAAIASAEADVETAQAGIRTAKAAVAEAQLDLDYTRITAPIAGRIGARLVTEGNLIGGSNALSTLLTTIVSLNPIHAYFDANERAYLKYVRLARDGARQSSRDAKNPVYLALEDEKGFPHVGHMDFVDNRIDSDTGTIRARAIFRNDDLVLTPGLFARVRIPGSARYEATLIPDAAITADQMQRLVYVLDDEDVVGIRPVELGPIINGLRVIRSGIQAKDRVVISGLQRIRPGMKAMPSLETLEPRPDADGLPDDYQPVPRKDWIRQATPGEASGR
jgi:membrane fusion protein, multidrug efflux system